MRLLAQARNPYSRSWLWIPGSRFARPGMTGVLFLSRQRLRGLPEHVPSRFLVERLLDEFADRQPRLHPGPRAGRRRVVQADHGKSAFVVAPTLEQSLFPLKPRHRHGRAIAVRRTASLPLAYAGHPRLAWR